MPIHQNAGEQSGDPAAVVQPKPRHQWPSDSKLNAKIRELREAKLTLIQMARRLDVDGFLRPETAAWRRLTWTTAYYSNKYGPAVRRWLKNAGSD